LWKTIVHSIILRKPEVAFALKLERNQLQGYARGVSKATTATQTTQNAAQSATTNLFDSIAPYLGQISFGALAGFATGYALKKIGRTALVIFGMLFIVIQLLAYLGVVRVDWLRIQQYADPLLSKNSLQGFFNGLTGILTNNVPFAGAFIPGFLLGLRAG
jgi:uncharacterized membrane protein (Fun14 family)